MKILLKILITLLFVITLFGSLLITMRNSNEASSPEYAIAEQMIEGMQALGIGDSLGDIPKQSEWRFAMILSVVLMLGSIVAIVAAYVKSKTFGLVVAGLVGVAALLLILFEPSIPDSLGSGKNPKTVATIIGIFGLIGAIALGGLKAMGGKSATTTPTV